MRTSDWTNNHSNVANYMFLMQSSNYTVSASDEHYLVRITLTGCGLSLVGCIICLFLICFLPRQKGDGPFIVANLCSALLTAQLAFIGAENAYPTRTWCKGATAVLHYLYLTIHFWSLCFSLHLMMKLLGILQTEKSKRRLMLMCIGWFLPTIIVGMTAVLRGDTYGKDQLCWLTAEKNTRLAFLGPVYFIMTVNFIVTIIMFIARLAHDSRKHVPLFKRLRHQLMTFITLVPVLSLTWVFGLSPASNMVSQYLFVIINSSQGLWILLGHMMFSTPIKALLLTKVMGEQPKPKKKEAEDSESSDEVSEDLTATSDLGPNLENEKKTAVLQYNCPAENVVRKPSTRRSHQVPAFHAELSDSSGGRNKEQDLGDGTTTA
ncbi:adhesion G protein-coupled receptor L4 isoform X1 [Patella vulgata]|uniref:adhesion G protein-coupled receptor L4 isoform X1 n=1 Tax=Patella vulgata TaxID=6465 RepID=UPI00217FF989|nr:adhesion G protein-coupled receptor L4 isoform X1 [Patella vulgata]